MKLSIIIPMYNEQESLDSLFVELSGLFSQETATEIIFINDGSSDNTLNILKSKIKNYPTWSIINLYRNYGKSVALQAGFDNSKGEIIATMDADLQDNPKEIYRLIEELDRGYDVVSGWKKNRKDPLEKKIASKIFNFFVRVFSGLKIHDSNCGIKVFKREVTEMLTLYGGRHRYIPLLAHQKKFLISEVVVDHREREFGISKYGVKRYSDGFFDFLTILFLGKYMDRPLHFFGSLGFISVLLGIGIESYVLYLKYILFDSFQQHIALIILGAILIIVGLQLFTFGLMGELIVNKKYKDRNYIKEIIE
ncbi:glycosyltransferase family 2 protein [Candidatus Marinimicrobia bacterium]|nr:glycosyltransferase family 2 protein [Candidatus Neomarinimicrobiota bacterium]MDB3883430.1 glycosyltransferase family 2 protein [Candidatus Neomarinimicrobiota bacterium]MDB3980505.1 glycosyltransferase family 2 protein [Candidatus Neomarinimicrobiota bacterium]MDC1145306.1 glycosyltransferase family 2 protein [Candidatus Neomarinimicrobiota bacterium]MDC3287762.1 glycosyltransferase family 2 protein [Candidatus Neomarinimicrobiota bacterium]